MAKSNELLKRGKVISISVESINNQTAFPDSKAKSYYLKLLKEGLNQYPAINVLAYAVLRESAYVLAYTTNETQLTNMILQINESYSIYFNDRFEYNGYVFRLPNQKTSIDNNGIIPAIAHIHKQPEYQNVSRNYRKYKYSSCYPIFMNFSKIVDKEFLLRLLDIDKLDGVTYTSWHKQNLNSKIKKERKGKEKYSKAMEVSTLRYRGTNLVTNEDALKQILMDVNERCDLPYRKLAKRMGIKDRRDILIEIIASMVFDRGYTFLDAINQLQAQEYGVFTLLLEVILSVNERSHFGYDYIINKLEVEDWNYSVLIEVIRSLNRKYGMGFVEIAKKFSLQNNIIEIRSRVGF